MVDERLAAKIYTFRGLQVMIDRDLAELYGVETKALNQAVKRNIERFPEGFRFQLSSAETEELVTNCDRFRSLKHSSSRPYAFTEQGVAMLSAVLRSPTAVEVSIRIMQAFVSMRRFLTVNDTLERRQVETDAKFEQVFDALEARHPAPAQGIFFEGQVFDAYTFVNDLFRSANHSIILIDNYVDDTVLLQLAKRKEGVKAVILTKKFTRQLKLDLERHNAQYPPVEILEFHAHDRFVILDGEEVYHLGASLKDLEPIPVGDIPPARFGNGWMQGGPTRAMWFIGKEVQRGRRRSQAGPGGSFSCGRIVSLGILDRDPPLSKLPASHCIPQENDGGDEPYRDRLLKKWFAFSRMEKGALVVMERVENILKGGGK